MDRPWLQLYTRDWLDDLNLRSVSCHSRGVLVDLMCIAHEGKPYGFLSKTVQKLSVSESKNDSELNCFESGSNQKMSEKMIASRCNMSVNKLRRAILDLEQHGRIAKNEQGVLFVPRMVKDECTRLKRSAGGHASIGHPSTHPPKRKEGYPSTHPSVDPPFESLRARAGQSQSQSQSIEETPAPNGAVSHECHESVTRVSGGKRTRKTETMTPWQTETFLRFMNIHPKRDIQVVSARAAWTKSVKTPDVADYLISRLSEQARGNTKYLHGPGKWLQDNLESYKLGIAHEEEAIFPPMFTAEDAEL